VTSESPLKINQTRAGELLQDPLAMSHLGRLDALKPQNKGLRPTVSDVYQQFPDLCKFVVENPIADHELSIDPVNIFQNNYRIESLPIPN
jgi:hypothetical protein